MNNKIAVYSVPRPNVRSYFELIDAVSEYGAKALEGFCHFELAVPDFDNAKRIREYADKKNIVCPCFSVFADLSLGDPGEMVEKLCRFADVAKILGSPYLHHTIIGECVDYGRVLGRKEELFELGIKAVREITDYAASIGIKTVYEDQGFIFNGVEGFGRFLSAVERDVGVVADMGNICQCGGNIHDFISAFGNKVCHVHVKDWNIYDSKPDRNVLPALNGKFCADAEIGLGGIDIARAVEQLKALGYSGYYAVEYTSPDENGASYLRGLERLENWIG